MFRILLFLLFNSIIYYGYVPSSFGGGIIIPILTDKNGDVSSVSNYRVTLSSNKVIRVVFIRNLWQLFIFI